MSFAHWVRAILWCVLIILAIALLCGIVQQRAALGQYEPQPIPTDLQLPTR